MRAMCKSTPTYRRCQTYVGPKHGHQQTKHRSSFPNYRLYYAAVLHCAGHRRQAVAAKLDKTHFLPAKALQYSLTDIRVNYLLRASGGHYFSVGLPHERGCAALLQCLGVRGVRGGHFDVAMCQGAQDVPMPSAFLMGHHRRYLAASLLLFSSALC